MPFCPKCKDEFRPEIVECPNCKVKLVKELPKEKPKAQKKPDNKDIFLCNNCGFPNPLANEKCQNCGSPLLKSTSDPYKTITEQMGHFYRGLARGQYEKKPAFYIGAFFFACLYIFLGIGTMIMLYGALKSGEKLLSLVFLGFSALYVLFGIKIIKGVLKK